MGSPRWLECARQNAIEERASERRREKKREGEEWMEGEREKG